MDIYEFIKLLFVEIKYEWGLLNFDYLFFLIFVDFCLYWLMFVVGFDLLRCIEL